MTKAKTRGMNPWDKGFIPPSLDSRLYPEEQVKGFPDDHPAWTDPKWGEKALKARQEDLEAGRCPGCHRSWDLISSYFCDECKGDHVDWREQRDEAKARKASRARARAAR